MEVAVSPKLLPEFAGAWFDWLNHLAKHCAQWSDPAGEAIKRSPQTTSFFFTLRGRVSARSTRVEIGLHLLHLRRDVRQPLCRQNAQGPPAKHTEKTCNSHPVLAVAIGKALIKSVPVNPVAGIAGANGTRT